MTFQEQPPREYNDNRELPEDATIQQKINEILEQAAGRDLTDEEKEKIKMLKYSLSVDPMIKEAMEKKPDGTEEWKSEPAAEEIA